MFEMESQNVTLKFHASCFTKLTIDFYMFAYEILPYMYIPTNPDKGLNWDTDPYRQKRTNINVCWL